MDESCSRRRRAFSTCSRSIKLPLLISIISTVGAISAGQRMLRKQQTILSGILAMTVELPSSELSRHRCQPQPQLQLLPVTAAQPESGSGVEEDFVFAILADLQT